MNNIFFPGAAVLVLMGLIRRFIGLFDQGNIVRGVVFFDMGNKNPVKLLGA